MQEQVNAFRVLLEAWGITARYTTPDNQKGSISVYWNEADISQASTKKNSSALFISQQSCIYAEADQLNMLPAGTLLTINNATFRMQQPQQSRGVAMAPIVLNGSDEPANDFGNFLRK